MDVKASRGTIAEDAALSSAERLQHLVVGMHLHFPKFRHEAHSPVVNVNQVADEQLTIGQRVADGVANRMGSWGFIIGQMIIMVLWITLNLVGWIFRWDPYPFILLNLAMSAQAAFATPLIMMSQNRQAQKDRLTAENDYTTDVKSEEEICHILEHLDHQDSLILQIVQRLEAQNERLAQQEKLTFEIVQRLEAQNERMKEQHREMLDMLINPHPERTPRMKDETDQ